ncbi:Uncharacterized protein Adt_14567 [Abeliophyllum distichum]|uniref:Uncharacterized protein n=1 Tax=Abeliophyllum distichum TaxID=126358 RepID=A0ABD1TZZ8_9LAMI
MGENATLIIREAIRVAIRTIRVAIKVTIRAAIGTKEKLQRANRVLLLEKMDASYVASSHCEADSEDDEDVIGAFLHRCSTISHRVIEKGEVSQKKVKKEELKPRVCKAKDLMYVDVKINGKPIKAMVDTDATHNYLASPEVERLGFVLEKGLEFLRNTKTAVLLFSDSLMMMGSKPCVIPTLVEKMDEKSISAMQFSKGFKRNERSFLCTLGLEEIKEATVPIQNLLEDFYKNLRTWASYHMSQSEIEEFRKQLVEMLDSGIIVPVKLPYRALVLFQKTVCECIKPTNKWNIGTISHRVIEKGEVSQKKVKKEELKPRVCKAKDLMYVDVKINGQPIKAMVYTDATHNYLTSPEVERLGLVLEKGSGKVKTINLVVQPIAGVAKSVLIKVGPFKGRTNLSAV